MATICENDIVVVYENRDSQKTIKITHGAILNNKYGSFPHDLIIGKKYGSKIMSKDFKGFIYILKLTPHLYTSSLPHRTQILFSMDISTIIYNLQILPGCTVVESGTGSGSLSYSIAKAVSPGGRLLTFEFNHDRAVAVKKDFEFLKMDTAINVTEEDVILNGFTGATYADAIFLDLPNPWDAIKHCKILKKRGRLCTFSPCIEQIQKTLDVMLAMGYGDITMYECLLRDYEHRSMKMIKLEDLGKRKEPDKTDVWGGMKSEKGHTGYLMFSVKYT